MVKKKSLTNFYYGKSSGLTLLGTGESLFLYINVLKYVSFLTEGLWMRMKKFKYMLKSGSSVLLLYIIIREYTLFKENLLMGQLFYLPNQI